MICCGVHRTQAGSRRAPGRRAARRAERDRIRVAGGPLPAWLLVMIGMLALIFAAPAGKAGRRVRRRRDRSPRRAILGAWWETTDRLREAGIAVGPALTTGEVVRLAPDPDEISRLAALVDAAAYAPDMRAAEAPALAWAAAMEVRRGLRAGMSAPRRVAAFFDPRPLFRRR